MTVLKDQVPVVTGASSGIGKAIALGLAGQGAFPLPARSKSGKLATGCRRRQEDGQCRCYQTNLEVDSEVLEVIASIKRTILSLPLLPDLAQVTQQLLIRHFERRNR
jgi:NAD(P)-dependent dehydrogenase (short-subunit alcohol dehydrogenase family)